MKNGSATVRTDGDRIDTVRAGKASFVPENGGATRVWPSRALVCPSLTSFIGSAVAQW